MAPRSHECVNCAAPLSIPDEHERFFRCEFCGTVIEDRSHTAEPVLVRAEQVPGEVLVTYGATRTTSSGTGSRLVVGLVLAVVALVVGGAVGMLRDTPTITDSSVEQLGDGERLTVDLPGGSGAAQLNVIRTAVLVPSDDDTTPDVVLSALGPTVDGALLLHLDREVEGGVRWTAEGPDVVNGRILVTDTFVVSSQDDRLTGHNRSNGAEVFDIVLSDEVQHTSCTDCVQVFGDVIVALSSDGVLTGVSTGGEVAWQVELRNDPRQLLDLGGMPAVLERTADDAVVLQLHEPTTGAVAATRTVDCHDPTFDRRREVGRYDPLFALDEGSFLLLGGNGPIGCAARFDPGDGGPVWETAVEYGFASRFGPEALLRVGATLVQAENDAAVAIDVTTGEVRDLARSEHHHFTPLLHGDGVVVLAVESTRGSRSWELWGVDLASGDQLWTFELAASSPLDLGIGGSLADDTWLAVLTNDGVTVGTLLEDEPLTLQTLPLRSGTASSPVQVQLPDGLIPQAATIGARGNDLYLVYEESVLLIDVTDGTATRLP